jgi:DNA-binding transcriptional LysR family regulator
LSLRSLRDEQTLALWLWRRIIRSSSFIRTAKTNSSLLRRDRTRLQTENGFAFAECLGRSFISLQPGAALHTFLMNHASALGGRLDVRVQVSSYGAIVKLVGSGAGIGIVAKSAIDGDAVRNVAVVALAEPWARRDLRVCVLRNAPVINPFRDRLLETLTAGQEIAGATAK